MTTATQNYIDLMLLHIRSWNRLSDEQLARIKMAMEACVDEGRLEPFERMIEEYEQLKTK